MSCLFADHRDIELEFQASEACGHAFALSGLCIPLIAE
jgi:hypothetical protein